MLDRHITLYLHIHLIPSLLLGTGGKLVHLMTNNLPSDLLKEVTVATLTADELGVHLSILGVPPNVISILSGKIIFS